MSQSISIKTDGGEFAAYLARPAAAKAPVVVVLHEVFGRQRRHAPDLRRPRRPGVHRGLSDLFWRQSPGVDLSVTSEADWQTGLALYTAYDRDEGVRDVVAAVAAARGLEGATGKVAVMGYCLGGLMTFLTAARSDVDAAVAYHGGDTEKYLGEAGAIRAPMLMHLADEDEFISKAAQAQIKAALADVPGAQVYSYPGCHHAFSRHGGAHYDAAAAALANGRTWAFLRANLA